MKKIYASKEFAKWLDSLKFFEWKLENRINTKDDAIGIIEAAFEDGEPEFILHIISQIAKSKGMTELAKELNLNRSTLYKSLSKEGNPSFLTVMKTLKILGLQIRVTAAS
jgi:probable addiction module antidote protein